MSRDPEPTGDEADPGSARPSRKLVYKSVGGSDLVLHVFEPAGAAKTARPALVFFHGGGWMKGDPSQFFHQADHLARRGIWTASASYRLTSGGHRVADAVADAQDAVRYIREHAAKLGVDPRRIAAGGGSAGGHLAAAAAVVPDTRAGAAVSCRPDLLVLFNPAFFHKRGEGTLTIEHFGRDTVPPAILFYGSADAMVAYGRQCLERSKAQGFSVALFVAEGQGHGFFNGGPWRDRTLFQADRFLAQHGYLQGPPTLKPSEGAVLTPVP